MSGKKVWIYVLVGVTAAAVILLIERTMKDAEKKAAREQTAAGETVRSAPEEETAEAVADYEVNRKTGEKQFLR